MEIFIRFQQIVGCLESLQVEAFQRNPTINSFNILMLHGIAWVKAPDYLSSPFFIFFLLLLHKRSSRAANCMTRS